MKKIVVDFETYYDTDYSLSKLQTDAYVLDNRFETMGVAVKVDEEPVQWYSGDDLHTAAWLQQFPWDESMVICHHALFDAFVMTQRYGIKPKLWFCTKMAATMLYPHLHSYSLASLAKTFSLEDKGTEVVMMIHRRRESLTPEETARYGEYCKLDVTLTWQLANHFLPRVPDLEHLLMDMTVRMFTEPKLVGDMQVLSDLYNTEVKRKETVLADCGLDKDVLMSNNKLAAALVMLGCAPPTKVSAKTNKVAYAFAKTDKEFTALENHEDPRVQALVSARLGVKSTIAETRSLRMLETATRGPLPVYLNYWGAKTTGRYSGGNQINWQNLPARGPAAGVRKGIVAPDGHVLVVGDSSNIELRVAMVAAGQNDVVAKIKAGDDLYCDFASKIFGRPITKADKQERMLGKIAMLSLQYGAGWIKFKEMVRIESTKAGSTLDISDDMAQNIVSLYRRVHDKIMAMHERFENVILPEIANGCLHLRPVEPHLGWCLCTGEGFGVAGGPGVVYHKLRQEVRADSPTRAAAMQWCYTQGKARVWVYGGKAFENYCQHIARQIVMWQTARYNARYQVALSVHDEIVSVVKESETDDAVAYMQECLGLAPAWCRGSIPLTGEVHHGHSYADAK